MTRSRVHLFFISGPQFYDICPMPGLIFSLYVLVTTFVCSSNLSIHGPFCHSFTPAQSVCDRGQGCKAELTLFSPESISSVIFPISTIRYRHNDTLRQQQQRVDALLLHQHRIEYKVHSQTVCLQKHLSDMCQCDCEFIQILKHFKVDTCKCYLFTMGSPMFKTSTVDI